MLDPLTTVVMAPPFTPASSIPMDIVFAPPTDVKTRATANAAIAVISFFAILPSPYLHAIVPYWSVSETTEA